MKGQAIAAAALAALALAGCGGTTASSAHSALSPANALVCKHYIAQRKWVKSLTFPTLADVEKLAMAIGADAADATPGTKLARDLNTMASSMGHQPAEYNASVRILHDCGSSP
jgi:hypothetical protein